MEAGSSPVGLLEPPRRLFAVIAAAKERARRRRLVLAVAAAAASMLALFAVLPQRTVTPPTTNALSPARVFAAQRPYLGVACRTPNGTRCGRLGVAVWMRQHVDQLVASMDDQTINLHDTTSGSARVRTYIGYFHMRADALRLPPRWTGEPPRLLRVNLRVRLDGHVVERTLRLQLHPGWG